MLLLAAASQLLLVTTPSRAVVFTGATLLGLAAQGTKIAVDTIVQRDTDDEFRGRAFAFYDVLYNAAFVGAAASPPSRSPTRAGRAVSSSRWRWRTASPRWSCGRGARARRPSRAATSCPTPGPPRARPRLTRPSSSTARATRADLLLPSAYR